MHLRSLGLRTDLAILARDGLIEDHGDHLVVRTPSNPSYWSGNALVLPALAADGLPTWEARFGAAFPEAEHRTLLVDLMDLAEPDLAALRVAAAARGFELRRTVALTAQALTPHPAPPGVTLRPLESDADWRAYTELVVESDGEDGLSGPGHEAYVHTTLAQRRAASSPALGRWWGAFEGEGLRASLGLLHLDGLGRYQHVVTARPARRRGLASALLTAAGADAQARGCHTLVIVAEDDSPALRLYERLGFGASERLFDLLRRPEAFRRPVAPST